MGYFGRRRRLGARAPRNHHATHRRLQLARAPHARSKFAVLSNCRDKRRSSLCSARRGSSASPGRIAHGRVDRHALCAPDSSRANARLEARTRAISKAHNPIALNRHSSRARAVTNARPPTTPRARNNDPIVLAQRALSRAALCAISARQAHSTDPNSGSVEALTALGARLART